MWHKLIEGNFTFNSHNPNQQGIMTFFVYVALWGLSGLLVNLITVMAGLQWLKTHLGISPKWTIRYVTHTYRPFVTPLISGLSLLSMMVVGPLAIILHLVSYLAVMSAVKRVKFLVEGGEEAVSFLEGYQERDSALWESLDTERVLERATALFGDKMFSELRLQHLRSRLGGISLEVDY